MFFIKVTNWSSLLERALVLKNKYAHRLTFNVKLRCWCKAELSVCVSTFQAMHAKLGRVNLFKQIQENSRHYFEFSSLLSEFNQSPLWTSSISTPVKITIFWKFLCILWIVIIEEKNKKPVHFTLQTRKCVENCWEEKSLSSLDVESYLCYCKRCQKFRKWNVKKTW